NQTAKELYTECGYETLLRVHRFAETGPTAVKSFNFGGWVKSDPLQRSFAGYKMAWFKDGDDVPLAEACTALVYSPSEWKRLETVSAAPAQADYGRFYCISVGVAGRTYFDDIYVTPSSSGRAPAEPQRSPAAYGGGDYEVGDRSLRLTVSSRGLWRLHHNDQPILLEGEFVMNSADVISKQSATIPENGIAAGVQQYQPGRQIRFTIPMLHPQTINWIDAVAEARHPDTARRDEPPSVQLFYSISKSVMAEESYSIIFRLLPGQIKGSLRFVAGSQTKERSHLEEITESDISETAIELSDCLLSIKYSDVVNLRVIRNGIWLEFIQTFTPPRTGDTAVVGIEFFVKPLLSDSASALQEIIAKAEELSKRDLLGQALQLYRDVLNQVDRKSAIAQRVQAQLSSLEDKAHRLVADASELVEVAGLLGDKTLYQQAGTLCQQVIKFYKNTEFDIQAHKILQQSEAGLKNIDTDSVEVNAEKVLTIADGYSKSGNNNLARWLYERVLERYPASAAAQEANAKLKDIK
ncbi:MAG: hypothetical protein HY762_03010, partial [Planctomycetes bacterium]|nr:hypothetical protein [Planctomycetota bacterium]